MSSIKNFNTLLNMLSEGKKSDLIKFNLKKLVAVFL